MYSFIFYFLFIYLFIYLCIPGIPNIPNSEFRIPSFRLFQSTQEFLIILGRVRLGSIRNKNNWNNANKRLFGELFSFRNTWIFIPAILLPGAE